MIHLKKELRQGQLLAAFGQMVRKQQSYYSQAKEPFSGSNCASWRNTLCHVISLSGTQLFQLAKKVFDKVDMGKRMGSRTGETQNQERQFTIKTTAENLNCIKKNFILKISCPERKGKYSGWTESNNDNQSIAEKHEVYLNLRNP